MFAAPVLGLNFDNRKGATQGDAQVLITLAAALW
jgi:hypothetical protein